MKEKVETYITLKQALAAKYGVHSFPLIGTSELCFFVLFLTLSASLQVDRCRTNLWQTSARFGRTLFFTLTSVSSLFSSFNVAIVYLPSLFFSFSFSGAGILGQQEEASGC
jgi:hypothetical protein